MKKICMAAALAACCLPTLFPYAVFAESGVPLQFSVDIDGATALIRISRVVLKSNTDSFSFEHLQDLHAQGIEVSYRGLQAQADSISLQSTRGASLERRGTLRINGLQLSAAGWQLPKANCNGEVLQSEQEYSSSLRLIGEDIRYSLVGAIQYQRPTDKLVLRLSLLPVDWQTLIAAFPSLTTFLPEGVAVESLEVAAHLGGERRNGSTFGEFFTVDLKNGSGGYYAIPIKEFSSRVRLEKDQDGSMQLFKVENAAFLMLDGQFKLPNAEFHLTRRSGDGIIQLNSVSLAAIAELYPSQRVAVSGSVSGSLPMQFAKEGLLISDGKLQSDDGGILRLKLLEAGSDDSYFRRQLGEAVEALRNYHYQSLEAAVQLQANGDAELAVQLSGRNPDFQGGRKINLNVNLEENIPALMESIAVGNNITGLTGRE